MRNKQIERQKKNQPCSEYKSAAENDGKNKSSDLGGLMGCDSADVVSHH